MKPSLSEDITSILAIALGATITIGLTGALLLREPARPAAMPIAVPVTRIPDGYRSVTVPVSDADAPGAVRGSRVDVMVTLNAVGADREPVTQVVLQNVPLLGHDWSMSVGESGQPVQVNFVTLLVTPAEAEKLAVAEAAGTLHLAVRGAVPTGDMPPRESGLLRRVPR